LTGDSHLRRAQYFIVPEIAAAQFINNGSRFTLVMVRHGNSFMPIMVECSTDAFEREDSMRLQECKKFVMDESHPLGKGLLLIAYRVERFLHVVDDLQERKENREFAFLGKLVSFPLYATAVVLEVRKGTQVSIALIAQIVPQQIDFSRQISRR
jgi:hypothetical protein